MGCQLSSQMTDFRSVEATEFRQAMQNLASGVAIVATGADTRTIRGQSEDRAVFTASPKSSNGTGHEPAIAVTSRPVTARTALTIVACL